MSVINKQAEQTIFYLSVVFIAGILYFYFMKKQLRVPAKCGIYSIGSIKSDYNIYIGSSINLRLRAYGHFSKLKCGRHGNSNLQQFYNIYGNKNIEFKVLKLCDENELVYFEQEFIKLLRPNFNIHFIAGRKFNVSHLNDKINPKNIALKDMDSHERTSLLSEYYIKKIKSTLDEFDEIFNDY